MSTQEQQYIKGFNHGYLLTKHLPDLVAKLAKDIKDATNEYFSGFFSGKAEYELEYSQEQINELKSIRAESKDRERNLDRE